MLLESKRKEWEANVVFFKKTAMKYEPIRSASKMLASVVGRNIYFALRMVNQRSLSDGCLPKDTNLHSTLKISIYLSICESYLIPKISTL